MDRPDPVLPDLRAQDARVRLRAGSTSLVVAVGLLGAKYWAYLLTGSTAMLSDALESIVNVVAAVFALGGLLFAGRPADRNHPYGHGKIEFFTAGLRGRPDRVRGRADPLGGGAGAARRRPRSANLDAGVLHRAGRRAW